MAVLMNIASFIGYHIIGSTIRLSMVDDNVLMMDYEVAPPSLEHKYDYKALWAHKGYRKHRKMIEMYKNRCEISSLGENPR